jgi:hypothetical protein
MRTELNNFDRHMSAAAFAEAGEHGMAVEMLHKEKKDSIEPEKTPATKKKPYPGMVIFGAVSLCGYFALMTHQGLISEEFTMGGWHAAYPVMTAVIFSFIHGAFASNLLSVLGIEAKNH